MALDRIEKYKRAFDILFWVTLFSAFFSWSPLALLTSESCFELADYIEFVFAMQ